MDGPTARKAGRRSRQKITYIPRLSRGQPIGVRRLRQGGTVRRFLGESIFEVIVAEGRKPPGLCCQRTRDLPGGLRLSANNAKTSVSEFPKRSASSH